MCQVIEQFAFEKGINSNDANLIFLFFSQYLATKIPELRPVIEDVFDNADPQKLQKDICKAIHSLQEQQWKEQFKDFRVAPPHVAYHQTCIGGELF